LWTQGPEIPLGVRIFEMRLGMALLGVNQIREFERIADEENRRVPTKSQFPSSV
jgi:hypothetical protein